MIRLQITDGTAALDSARWLGRLRDDVDFIQIREKDLNARELAALVRLALRVGPKILVNDRLDVALAVGAAGVHLRGSSVPPALVRRIAPPGFVISVAIHDGVEIPAEADHALVAPVFQPLSKRGTSPPLGLTGLRRIARASAIPVIALGGITPENAAACMEAGAAGVAGITLFGFR